MDIVAVCGMVCFAGYVSNTRTAAAEPNAHPNTEPHVRLVPIESKKDISSGIETINPMDYIEQRVTPVHLPDNTALKGKEISINNDIRGTEDMYPRDLRNTTIVRDIPPDNVHMNMTQLVHDDTNVYDIMRENDRQKARSAPMGTVTASVFRQDPEYTNSAPPQVHISTAKPVRQNTSFRPSVDTMHLPLQLDTRRTGPLFSHELHMTDIEGVTRRDAPHQKADFSRVAGIPTDPLQKQVLFTSSVVRSKHPDGNLAPPLVNGRTSMAQPKEVRIMDNIRTVPGAGNTDPTPRSYGPRVAFSKRGSVITNTNINPYSRPDTTDRVIARQNNVGREKHVNEVHNFVGPSYAEDETVNIPRYRRVLHNKPIEVNNFRQAPDALNLTGPTRYFQSRVPHLQQSVIRTTKEIGVDDQRNKRTVLLLPREQTQVTQQVLRDVDDRTVHIDPVNAGPELDINMY